MKEDLKKSREYIFIRHMLEKVEYANDPAECVYKLTGDPKIAAMYLAFNESGQSNQVLRKMNTQSDKANHKFMKNLIKSGKKHINQR